MIKNGNGFHADNVFTAEQELSETLGEIKHFLQKNIRDLTIQVDKKDAEIKTLKDTLEKTQQQAEGNGQIINKLLGELTKLKNDIEWYKLTYEKRSLLGVLKDKIKFYFR